MNPNLCRVALRPRDLFEVFDLTLRLIRERIGPLARLTALVVGPLIALFSALSWWTEGAVWLLPAAILIGPVIQAPFTLGGGRLLFGDELSSWPITREAASRTPNLWFGWVVQALGWGLVMAAGAAAPSPAGWVFVLMGLGAGVFVGLVGVFLPEAVLLERVSISRALRRSNRLAASSGGGAVGATIGRAFLLCWCALAAEALGQGVVGYLFQLGAPLGAVASGDATPFLLGGVLLAHPLIALYRLLLYVDARTRSEGWDLQVSLRALGLA